MVRIAKKERDAVMAERPSVGVGGSGRRRSLRDSCETVAGSSSHRATSGSSKERRTKRSNKPMKERWLLTRKTWRYMADAGRRLIPDGTHNRAEDIPKIEQYFQEVCQKEPKFLLWRKASYPGSLAFRAHRNRRLVKGGSCRTKASSADEADDSRGSSTHALIFQATSGGRFDPGKMKRDWLLASGNISTAPITQRRAPVIVRSTEHRQDDAEAKALADMLQKYLNMHGGESSSSSAEAAATTATAITRIKEKKISSSASGDSVTSTSNAIPFDYQSLIDKLQQHLNLIMSEGKDTATLIRERTSSPSTFAFNSSNISSSRNFTPAKPMLSYRGDYVHKSLLETLSRHYAKSPNREHVISGILTDRKLLEKLYFDLRCTRGFRGPRATGAYTSSPRWWGNPRNNLPNINVKDGKSNLISSPPPPLIAVQGPSTDPSPIDTTVQTDPLSKDILEALIAEREKEERDSGGVRDSGKSSRRRSSVENDDVSPSVSDTIKRYLRMARKKSMDADKADRFKRVNYDKNLRNIKAKGEITKPGDDDGNSKGCQTEDNWMIRYKYSHSGLLSSEAGNDHFSDADTTTSPASRNASSRSSIDAGLGSEETPSTPKHHHHQSFLSHLLHGSNPHKDKPHSAPGSPALTSLNSAGGAAMQKSKSSSSVVHHGSRLVAKKIWRSRSKSTSRTVNQPSIWTPQVSCFFFPLSTRNTCTSFLLFVNIISA